MDGLKSSMAFTLLIPLIYLVSISLIRFVYASRLLTLPNEARALITEYGVSNLSALHPSGPSPIKITYCVNVLPCVLSSQYNYYNTGKKKKNPRRIEYHWYLMTHSTATLMQTRRWLML